jgi:phosphatidylglycerophosphate synthase
VVIGGGMSPAGWNTTASGISNAGLDKNTARVIADALTWARIVSVVPITLLAWYELKWWVLALYAAAALTDLLDGMFARRAVPSTSTVDFDGLADLLLSIMTLLWLWWLIPGFWPKYWLPYIPVLVVLEIYMTTVRARYPQMSVPHFEFGRFSMALFFFLLPVLIIWGDVPWFVHLVLILGTASKAQLAWAMAQQESRV